MNARRLTLIAFVLLMVCLSSIGYAQVSGSLSISGQASVTGKTYDLYISDAKEISAEGQTAQVSSLSYAGTLLTSTVILSGNDSIVTVQVTIVNETGKDMVYNRTVYGEEDTGYDNNDIVFSLQGMRSGQRLRNDASVTFTVSFQRSENPSGNSLILNSVLKFEFAEAIDFGEETTETPTEPIDPPQPSETETDAPAEIETEAPDEPETEVGVDFDQMIELVLEATYGLNDADKGTVSHNVIREYGYLRPGIKGVQGGQTDHFFTGASVDNLGYVFQYVTDTEYYFYMFKKADAEAELGTNPYGRCLTYKLVFYLDPDTQKWVYDSAMIGYANVIDWNAKGWPYSIDYDTWGVNRAAAPLI